MSLCIALNNPGNYVVIAGDGRLTERSDGTIIKDDHLKLTLLTDHISMFCSGAQDYCEELRVIVDDGIKSKRHQTLSSIANFVQESSLDIHNRFTRDYPLYLSSDASATSLATLIAYYDKLSGKTGYIEFCHTDNFVPHDCMENKVQLRGLGRDVGIEYIVRSFDPADPIASVLNTFDYVQQHESAVGGTITIHVINKDGTSIYERKCTQ